MLWTQIFHDYLNSYAGSFPVPRKLEDSQGRNVVCTALAPLPLACEFSTAFRGETSAQLSIPRKGAIIKLLEDDGLGLYSPHQ